MNFLKMVEQQAKDWGYEGKGDFRGSDLGAGAGQRRKLGLLDGLLGGATSTAGSGGGGSLTGQVCMYV